MEPVKREEMPQQRAFENSEIAAGVPEVHAENGFSRRPRDGRRESPEGIIPPLGSYAADEVKVCELLQHAGEIGWVVLEVTVEGRNDAAPADRKSRPERRALPAMPEQANRSDARLCPLHREE